MANERFDPVSLEIMWSRMLNVAEEMWSTVLRTAVSTIIASANDFGCEVLDAEGRVHRARLPFHAGLQHDDAQRHKGDTQEVSGGVDAPGRRVHDQRPVDVRRAPAGHRHRLACVPPGTIRGIRGQHCQHFRHRRLAGRKGGHRLIRRGHLLPSLQIVRQG